MYAYGKALGEEYAERGVNVALGPVGGPLGRLARAGRNQDGPGPDPYATGVQMEERIKGMQGADVIACSKVSLQAKRHFGFVEGHPNKEIQALEIG